MYQMAYFGIYAVKNSQIRYFWMLKDLNESTKLIAFSHFFHVWAKLLIFHNFLKLNFSKTCHLQ